LCFREWLLTALAYNRGFKTTPWIGEWTSSGSIKEIKKGETVKKLFFHFSGGMSLN
jgi:hypothetical protein